MKKYFLQFLYFVLLFSITSCGVNRSLKDRPNLDGFSEIDTVRTVHNDSLLTIGKNTLLKNKYGVWELYLEGDALERGLINGSLTKELMAKQEIAIMTKIESLVPSKSYQKFLSKMVKFFNRKMYKYVPEEYKQEIYGISRFSLEKYDFFAPAYVRAMYLHGAHDIGHALQDLMLVGCTSFAAWDGKTSDGKLLLGRNFDFYAGDDFAEEKIVAFINPTEGHKFMMYTWGGFIGAVSGLNTQGLSVTINAGKSKIPLLAKTPISLVAREILQYAGTIDEAVAIAKKRKVFVSEAIMIGSAKDHKAVLIEVSPNNFGVFEVENSDHIVCSNHFQSAAYNSDRRNTKAIEESHSAYRFKRMQELLDSTDKLDPEKAVAILRNRNGLNGKKIGLGNEKAINQLLAHHGIIFKPEDLKVWVSANPYQLGEFIAYDLNDAFNKFERGNVKNSVSNVQATISKDEFVNSKEFSDYEAFRKLSQQIELNLLSGQEIKEQDVQKLQILNPYYWKSYSITGDYYYEREDYKMAIINYKKALRLEITTLPDRKGLIKRMNKSYRKL